jgi:hypothetical protein
MTPSTPLTTPPGRVRESAWPQVPVEGADPQSWPVVLLKSLVISPFG